MTTLHRVERPPGMFERWGRRADESLALRVLRWLVVVILLTGMAAGILLSAFAVMIGVLLAVEALLPLVGVDWNPSQASQNVIAASVVGGGFAMGTLLLILDTRFELRWKYEHWRFERMTRKWDDSAEREA